MVTDRTQFDILANMRPAPERHPSEAERLQEELDNERKLSAWLRARLDNVCRESSWMRDRIREAGEMLAAVAHDMRTEPVVAGMSLRGRYAEWRRQVDRFIEKGCADA